MKTRVQAILAGMKARGYDPRVFETKRTLKRQIWLVAKGRKTTRTLRSKHLVGKAADIVDRKTLWSNPAFFVALKEEAEKVGMHTLGFEGCHCEWRG